MGATSKKSPRTYVYAAGFLPVVYENGTIVPGSLFSVWNIFQTISDLVPGLSRMSGPHAAGSIIVHTIQTQFRQEGFDLTAQFS